MEPESLLNVFVLHLLPADILFIEPVAQVLVVAVDLIVDAAQSGHPDSIVVGLSHQVQPVVLVQNMQQDGLDPTDDLLPVLQVGQVGDRVLLLHLLMLFLLPLLFRDVVVFNLPVGNQNILQSEPNQLSRSSNGPVY